MAKSAPRSDPPSPRSPSPPDPRLGFAHGVLKLGAFVVGLPAALLCGMALVGALTGNGYVRAIVAVVVVVGLPLVIADRLLPSEPTRAPGLVSDVCAVTWMLLTFGLAAAAGGMTRPLLTTEGDRLVAAGHEDIARGAFFLAGLRVEPVAVPEPASSASSATSDSAAPAGDGGPAPSTSASADAGAHRPKPDKAADRTPADLFKEVSPSVVTISVHTNQYDGGGTGFLIDKDGTIATNHHVIDGALRVQVKFLNGSVFEDGDLLVDEDKADLALLRIDLSHPVDGGRVDVKPLVLGNSDEVVVGEHAIVIGNPLGLESTLTDGLVSSRRLYEGRPWIQFSAPIGSGNSGGPVLNMRGEVIGVTTASIANGRVAQNLNLAVPINELKKLIRTDYPNRRKLGGGSATGHW